MKKKLPTTAITNELAGASAFFQKSAVKAASTSRAEEPVKNDPVSPPHSHQTITPPPLPSSVVNSETIDIATSNMIQEKKERKTSRKQDVTKEVMTSLMQDVDKRAWRNMIEETETHNSSLRMSVKEREEMEDLVRTLRRKYKIKTSMNEIARLGLLLLIHDFMQNGDKSVIAEVKKS